MLTTTQLKSLLRAHHLRLTKRQGQHHLVDAHVIQRVVESCQLSRHDTVVEIGAGLGALTESLAAEAGRVIAVEVAEPIARLLAERMRPYPNVAVVCQDILAFPWHRVRGVTVVGAIPYAITSPILVSLSEARPSIRQTFLIVQAEVAKRLVARPGTKAYGRLSVLCQYTWQATLRFPIPRSAFFPSPAVESCCVQLVPGPSPRVRVNDEQLFFRLVKAAFSHRRKTLLNCLREWGARRELERSLTALGLPASVRGEALSLEQFAVLANLFTTHPGRPAREGVPQSK